MSGDLDPDYDPSADSDDDDDLSSEPGSTRNTNKRDSIQHDQENDSSLSENDQQARMGEKSNRNIQNRNMVMYHCSCCYYQTPSRGALKKHVKICKPSNVKLYYQCPRCDIRYNLGDLLHEQSEDQTSLDHRVFHCPVCSFKAKKKSEDTILEKIHSLSQGYSCPCCKVKINGPHAFKTHLNNEHGVSLTYKCEYCGHSSSDADSFLEHKRTHADMQEMGLIQCSHCHFEFFNITEFKEHMKKVKWEKEAKKLQEDAKDVLEKKKEHLLSKKLEREVKVETSEMDIFRDKTDVGNWQLRCTLCQYVNYSRAGCERHVKNKHRASGHSMVKFNKYYDNKFKGSIVIGKIKDNQKAERTSTQELLKILDWTQSDEENEPEEMVVDNSDTREVITIEMASDIDEEITEESSENNDKILKIKDGIPLSHDANNEKKIQCNECSYKAKNKLHLSIHQQLIHEMLDKDYLYRCPQRLCTYASPKRYRLKSHLSRYHKVKLDIFYPSELKCQDCDYAGKRPHHLFIHRNHAHKKRKLPPHSLLEEDHNSELSPNNSEPNFGEDASKIEPPINNYKEPEVEQTEAKNSQLGCKQCGEKYHEMYKLAWHLFKSHSNKSELQKWRLKCKECNYESNSKLDCHKHGMQHKVSEVKFYKYYLGKLKGAIGFRYKQAKNYEYLQKSKFQRRLVEKFPKSKEEVAGNEEVPAKIQEETTHSSDKNTVDTSEENDHQRLDNDGCVLLEKKHEFFTCSNCTYETKHKTHLPLHAILVHCAPVSVGKTRYPCIDCGFNSKYRHSLKRHLENVHKYDIEVLFYNKEQAVVETSKPDDTKIKEEKDKEYHKYNCNVCQNKYNDRYTRDWHMFRQHRNKTEVKKWTIRCSLCNYVGWSRKYARTHAVIKHGNTKEPVMVKFDKYYGNKLDGSFNFKIDEAKMHHCIQCDYAASSWEYLRQHVRSHNTNQRGQEMGKDKRRNVELNPVNSENEDAENDIEEINSFYETTDQDEIIKIEIASDSDDEINENQDLSPNEEEFEHYEALPDEDFITSKRSDSPKDNVRQKSYDNEDVTSVNDDKVDNDDLSENKNEFNEGNDERHKSDEEETFLKSAEGTNKDKDLSDSNEEIKETEKHNQRNLNLRSSKRQRSSGIKEISFQNDEDADNNRNDEDAKSNESDDEDSKEKSATQKKPLLPNISYVTNKCIDRHCKYETSNKPHLKRHCLRVHSYSNKELDNYFSKLNQYECDMCKFQSTTRNTMNTHVRTHEKKTSYVCKTCKGQSKDKYRQALHMFTLHGDDTEIMKWSLRCTLCNYENHWTKYATKHGVTHSSTTGPTTVKFKKFYENTFEGVITYQYGTRKLHRCSKCEYVTGTWECLNKHLERHKRNNFVPQYLANLHKKGQNSTNKKAELVQRTRQRYNKSSVCPRCHLINDKYRRANHMFELHGNTIEILKCNFRCTVCTYETHYTKYAYKHGRTHSSTKGPTVVKFKRSYKNKFDGFYNCRYGIAPVFRCKLCSFVTIRSEGLRIHNQRHKTRTFKPRYKMKNKEIDYIEGERERLEKDADSAVEQTNLESDTDIEGYSKQQILDIIGLSSPETKRKREKLTGKSSKKIKKEEITPSSKEIREPKRKTLNPFSGEFVIEESGDEHLLNDELGESSNKTSSGRPQKFKCTKIDCKYSSVSLQETTNHIKLCAQDIYRTVKQFNCLLCKEVIVSRNSLQKHTNAHAATENNPDLVVGFSEFTNETFTCDIEMKANTDDSSAKRTGKGSYKCWMCGGVIITKKALTNHTNIHAREDDNFNLKVRYSKFFGDVLEGTIVMHADANYVPPKKKQAKSPEPEYDPSLPVFACDECNFKTNAKDALKKHKNLHWTSEKDALYKAQKWFTCSVCFFHCFDVNKYKEHCEWHKTHYSGTGTIDKLGKNSWFLK